MSLSTKNSRDSNIFSCIMMSPFALRRGDDGDGHGIGGERRPRLIFELRHVVAEVGLDLPPLLCRHDEIVAVLDAFDAEPRESHSRRAEMLDARRFDPQLRACRRGESDERSDFDVVGPDRMLDLLAAKRSTAFDYQVVGANSLNSRAQRNEKEMREVLHVRLAGRVAQNRLALGGAGSHECVLRCRDARLVEEDVGSSEPRNGDVQQPFSKVIFAPSCSRARK